jgi:predicted NUDIX family phosphoesterase
MKPDEKVLCVPRTGLPESWVKSPSVNNLKASQCFKVLKEAGGVFIPRGQVENDPAFKQIIPYVIVRERESHLLASYRRAGSEARLHNLISCGIGGHVARIDAVHNGCELESIIYGGLERELKEEFLSFPGGERRHFLGVINEDVTPVGSVHLGLVFLLEVSDRRVVIPGKELKEFGWMDRTALERCPLELWSRLALLLI